MTKPPEPGFAGPDPTKSKPPSALLRTSYWASNCRSKQRHSSASSMNLTLVRFSRIVQSIQFKPNVRDLLFNRDPFFAGAGIGHGLDDAHVTDAVFETWTRTNAAF